MIVKIRNKGLLEIEMSNKGNILDANYTLRTVEMAQRHKDSIRIYKSEENM